MKQYLQDAILYKYKLCFRGQEAMKELFHHGIECGDGWYQLIDDACLQIEAYLEQMFDARPDVKTPRITRIWQENDRLKIRITPRNAYLDLLAKQYSEQSKFVCEGCGSYFKNEGIHLGRCMTNKYM
ncbi:hypothetical protein LIN78_03665 [Leeia sp. TBRC 13508]|uniref:Uncharacterized protein n=1 Tax=Leeia speluncae TaxID=2884804 RepID=A0ABS8D399_9NEIS|nr:hypothetical protein [Leeia speluncae]MCB6182649.1 hypothetical protein [Leeia speluncae]